MNMRDQLLTSIITGILAILLLGGTVALLIMGKSVPEFLVGFDGVIVTAAFANGAFFAQARTATPTANALASLTDKYHELAMSGTQNVRTGTSGTTAPTTGGSN